MKILTDEEVKDNAEKWVLIARRVLKGQFLGADKSTRDSIRIGLRSINHEDCKRALEQLK